MPGIRKTISIMAGLLVVQPFVFAQEPGEIISEQEVFAVVQFLASDSLKGRGNGRDELLKAGVFIGNAFKDAGLQTFHQPGYYLPFRPFGGSRNAKPDELIWNGKKISTDQFIYHHKAPGMYAPKRLTDFTVIRIDSFFTEDIYSKYAAVQGNLLLWTNLPQPGNEEYFPSLIKWPGQGLDRDVLLVCAADAPTSLQLSGDAKYYDNLEYNVVGMLKGKKRPEEIILFSAHYDHEGVFRRGRKRDSIMNGANDNASGTAALLTLARYFAKRNDNDRTLLFCAFAGEELGLKGSESFADEINASSIVAGINIEMIGISQYGKNDVFITGPGLSDLPAMLEKGFAATPVRVKPGPSEEKELFKRSDNYSFVKKGVPAHTIMSSDDDEKCYHRPCDEAGRIEIDHMTTIIKAIAIAARSLIKGEETPKRIK